MSIQSFQAFMAQVGTDSALRDELRSKAPDGMSIEQLASEAAARGFAFSASDVTSELSESDLDAVAGGLGWKVSPVQYKWGPAGFGTGVASIDTHIKQTGASASITPSGIFKF